MQWLDAASCLVLCGQIRGLQQPPCAGFWEGGKEDRESGSQHGAHHHAQPKLNDGFHRERLLSMALAQAPARWWDYLRTRTRRSATIPVQTNDRS
jgi:hypothetical protein